MKQIIKNRITKFVGPLLTGVLMALAVGPAQATTTKYKVDTVRYENKGVYLAMPKVVFEHTKDDGSTVNCSIVFKAAIANGELASYNLEKSPVDQGNWQPSEGNPSSCSKTPVEGSEVWMRVNIRSGDNVHCRKDGAKYFYYPDGGTVKYVTKGTTHNNNHCKNHSPDDKWIFD